MSDFQVLPSAENYDEFVDQCWFYDPRAHGMMPELGYTALALAGEVGEVCEKVKKAYRETDGKVDQKELAKELGDVLFYLVKLGHLVDHDSSEIVKASIEKLRDRKLRGKMHGNGDNR